jgi:flagellar motor switch protein FliN/FliY
MSEPHVEQAPQEPKASSEAEEEISWEDAMEDLEKQKQMIQASQKATQASRVTAKPQAEREDTETHILNPDEGLRSQNLRFLLDIPLQVTVELGRKRLVVHDLLQLNQGSVIELTKQIGEPFEVLVNQKLIARGEVVVINDKFGVRITDIISPTERVQQLQ